MTDRLEGSPNVAIRRAQEKDLAECAVCYGDRQDTYPSIYPKKLRRLDISPEERLQANVESLKTELENHKKVFHVAVIPGAGKVDVNEIVVGYSIWQQPNHIAGTSQISGDTVAPKKETSAKSECQKKIESECDMVLARQIEQEGIQAKLQYCGVNSWLVDMIRRSLCRC